MTTTADVNVRLLVAQFAAMLAITAAILFVAAGTIAWPAGWAFLVVTFVPSAVGYWWLVRHDPGLIAERMTGLDKSDHSRWDRLFVLVAWVSLGIGVLAIAIVTWLSVHERAPEFALRRAVGARRRHLAVHVIWESAIVGLLGGLAGASLGLAVVVLVTHVRHWAPVLAPVMVLPAPLAGAAAGVLAGLVPALRAARTAPAVGLSTAATVS